jgi:hypothetical protein
MRPPTCSAVRRRVASTVLERPDRSRRDRSRPSGGLAALRAQIVPAITRLPGFRSGEWLTGNKSGQGLSLTLWDPAEAANVMPPSGVRACVHLTVERVDAATREQVVGDRPLDAGRASCSRTLSCQHTSCRPASCSSATAASACRTDNTAKSWRLPAPAPIGAATRRAQMCARPRAGVGFTRMAP